MTVVATHLLPGGVGLCSTVTDRKGLVHLDLAQRRAAIVGAMAVGAGRQRCSFGVIVVLFDPHAAGGMHAVRPAADGHRHGLVTGRAFADGACVALHILAQHIVVDMRAWVLGMGGAVARLALQAAVAL